MCGRRQPTLAGELESFRGLEVLWTTQAQPHRRHVTVYSSQDWTPGLGLQSHSCPGCCLSPHQKVQEVGFGWCEGSSGAVSPPQFLCSGTSAVAWTAAATCWCMSPSEQHVPERQCVVTPTLEAPSCPGLCLVTSSEVAVPRVLTGCVMLEHSPGSRWVCPGQAQDWEYRAVPGSWTEGQALGC